MLDTESRLLGLMDRPVALPQDLSEITEILRRLKPYWCHHEIRTQILTKDGGRISGKISGIITETVIEIDGKQIRAINIQRIEHDFVGQ